MEEKKKLNLFSPAVVQQLRKKYGFKNSKSLGQNFIADRNVIENIIEGSGITEDDLVIEIGPGLGVLTAAAAEIAKKVVAIEIDKNLLPILNETLGAYENIEIINEDILKVNLNELIARLQSETPGGFDKVRVIGNLPYYISTPIIMSLLETGIDADSITCMMQKEVAQRITAPCGKKEYGAISVAVGYYCKSTLLFDVSRNVFIPAPKVDSAVLRLDMRTESPVELKDRKVFFACIKAGFGQRRKTLGNAMTGIYGIDKASVQKLLAKAKIEPSRRAETLTLEEFATLANVVAEEIQNK